MSQFHHIYGDPNLTVASATIVAKHRSESKEERLGDARIASAWMSDSTTLRTSHYKVKVKSSMARSLPVENLLPQNVGSIINYLQ